MRKWVFAVMIVSLLFSVNAFAEDKDFKIAAIFQTAIEEPWDGAIHQACLKAKEDGRDIGCLILTDHPAEDQWELIYQGVLPEARGRGFGLEITRHAQWLTSQAGRSRLVLAVDAGNSPAIAAYASAGFQQWDRRYVFVKALS